MSDLDRRVGEALAELGVEGGRAIVAVSGGPDSVALLDLVHRQAASRRLDLVVAHLDHGIHPDSARVAEAVRALAAERDLPIEIGCASLGPSASETLARRCRIEWLETVRAAREARWLLTAHHRDDQVETILMRLLRGSGVAGLAGIAAAHGPWRRPLLGVARAELAAHLDVRGLAAWTDPANRDRRHDRAWLRADVLPLLEARVPEAGRHLLRTARAARENRTAWDDLLDEVPGLDFRGEGTGASVAAAPLAGYSSAVVRGLISALAIRLGWPLGVNRVRRIQALLAEGHSGRRLELFSGRVATLEQGRLRLYRAVAHPACTGPVLPGRVDAIAGWSIEACLASAPARLDRYGMETWFPAEAVVEVRCWMAGDRIAPLGGAGHRSVVRCMQDRKVPRHRRPGWPVFVRDGVVVWVPGVCRSGVLLPIPGTEAMRVNARAS